MEDSERRKMIWAEKNVREDIMMDFTNKIKNGFGYILRGEFVDHPKSHLFLKAGYLFLIFYMVITL